MPLRNVLLRAMLWSLAFAATTGVLAVLFQAGDLVWRVVGTGFTTALACGLMLPVSGMIDRKQSRAAGLLGMGAVIAEFLMALAVIWEAPLHVFGVYWGDEIGLTMLILAVAVVVIVYLLQLKHAQYGLFAGRLGLYVTLATFVAFMIATWVPGRVFNNDKWWETGSAVVTLGALAAVSLIGAGCGERRDWRWAGVGASLVACAMWLFEIWIGHGSDLGFVILSVLISLAAVVAHANLTYFCPLTPGQLWVRGGAIIAGTLTAGLIDLIIIDHRFSGIDLDEDLLGRLASASGIVTGCGTLALCVLARLNRKVDLESYVAELTEMTVVCPRCRKKQLVHVGDSDCAGCGLRISIRVEEPRCKQCDYLLYGLTSDRCPECGAVIGSKTPGDHTDRE
ncbi:MAG: hypothetical protein V3W34_13930 [Phycisphaerae bacterium]